MIYTLNRRTAQMPIDSSHRKMIPILRAIILNGNRPLTITDAARALNIGRPALSNLLNGKSDLSLELAVKIEEVFRYSALNLLTRQIEFKLEEYIKRTRIRFPFHSFVEAKIDG